MFDEVYCDAALPDGRYPRGTCFQLREYRARFLSGQLQNIVRVDEEGADRVRYGLASFRWFEPRSFLFGDPDEASETSKDDVGLGE